MDISLQLNEALIGTPAYRDLIIGGNGDLVLTQDANPDGTEPVAQQVTQRLRFIAGEWFMNTDLGVPYYQQILGQRGKTAAFEAVLQNTVLSTPGVISLLTWTTTVDGAKRIMTVSFVAQTTSGVINYSTNLSPQAGSDG